MQRRHVPFLIRAIILFLASLPLARAAATSSAEAHSLGGAHVHEAGVAGPAGLVVPAVVATGVALVTMTHVAEGRPASEVESPAAVSRAASQPSVRARAIAMCPALSHPVAAVLRDGAATPAHRRGLHGLRSLAPFPYKARSLTGTLTARAP